MKKFSRRKLFRRLAETQLEYLFLACFYYIYLFDIEEIKKPIIKFIVVQRNSMICQKNSMIFISFHFSIYFLRTAPFIPQKKEIK